jgi:uncharacterized protein (UPF0332 family)
MKENLDRESIKALTAYRIQRAEETLLEAETLIKGKFYNAAVNRLYYACYYAVIALLVKHSISAHSHAGVKQMFGLHFIVTQKIPAQLGRFYNQLFNDRITGDYDDFVTYDQEMLDELFPNALGFIQAIKKLVDYDHKS